MPQKRPFLPAFNSLLVVAVDSMLRRADWASSFAWPSAFAWPAADTTADKTEGQATSSFVKTVGRKMADEFPPFHRTMASSW
jgi:hypothetical protein